MSKDPAYYPSRRVVRDCPNEPLCWERSFTHDLVLVILLMKQYTHQCAAFDLLISYLAHISHNDVSNAIRYDWYLQSC